MPSSTREDAPTDAEVVTEKKRSSRFRLGRSSSNNSRASRGKVQQLNTSLADGHGGDYSLNLEWQGSGDASEEPPRFGCRQTEFNVTETQLEDSPQDEVPPLRPWGHQLVIHDSNPSRTAWNFVVSILLVYTATVFPYHLVFLEFRIRDSTTGDGPGWQNINLVVDVLFWIDLFLNFFFTYEDRREGVEVEDLRLIMCHYIRGYFILNLVACVPPDLMAKAIQIFMGDASGGSFGKLTRVSRVQRVGRLVRLARFAKLVHGCPAITDSPLWIWLQNQRGVRIVNFVVGLFLVVHLMGCGWYLCAALHSEEHVDHTWVALREAGGQTLLERAPVDQWLHAMYFILTVFSTVGFGDMAASTNGEIVYVIFVMLLGAVVHGIIMSEVINVVTKMDDKAAALSEQKELLSAFAQHTDLDERTTAEFKQWITRPQKASKRRYDREAMRKLLVAGHLPRALIQDLAENIFRGELLRNKFLQVCVDWAPDGALPPRFPLLLALAANQHIFQTGEVVYQLHDHPFNIFLVLAGTFASIGLPGVNGGVDCMTSMTNPHHTSTSTYIRGLQSLRRLGHHTGPKQRSSSTRGPRAKKLREAAGTTHEAASSVPRHKVYPYQLHGPGSYFGDYEILVDPLHKGLNRSRCSTVRCESPAGQVLVLTSADVLQLAQDFPHYGTAWRTVAIRRESTRQLLLQRHKRGFDYRGLAAAILQRYFRRLLRRTAGESSPEYKHSGRRCADMLDKMFITAEQRGLTSSASLGEGFMAPLADGVPAPSRSVPHMLPAAQHTNGSMISLSQASEEHPQQLLLPHQVAHEPLTLPYSSSKKNAASHPIASHSSPWPTLSSGSAHHAQEGKACLAVDELRKEMKSEIHHAKEELRAEIRTALADIKALVLQSTQQTRQPLPTVQPEVPTVESEGLEELTLPGDV